MNKRTKAVSISPKVRKQVRDRDSCSGVPCCIFCGKPNANQVMHFVPRSSGGLGVLENLAIGCFECHHKLDQTSYRKKMLEYFEEYLKQCHPSWSREELIYRR